MRHKKTVVEEKDTFTGHLQPEHPSYEYLKLLLKMIKPERRKEALERWEREPGVDPKIISRLKDELI